MSTPNNDSPATQPWAEAAKTRARERALPWIKEGTDRVVAGMSSTDLIQALYSHEIDALKFAPPDLSAARTEATLWQRKFEGAQAENEKLRTHLSAMQSPAKGEQ